MLALLTLITTVFAADCPESLTRDALSQRLDRATASYRDLDSDGFFVAMASVEADLPCTDSVLLPSEVARLHRLWGVTLYSRDGVLTAMPAFQAANRVDPEGSLPSDLVPEGHELWQLSRQIGRGESVRLPPAAPRTDLYIDGAITRDRPLEEPVVVQIVTDGELMATHYVPAGDPFPEYRLSTGPKTRRTVLAISSAVFAATAITTYGLAYSQGTPLRNGDVPMDWTRDDVSARQSQVNTLAGVAIGSALLSVAFGTTAIAL